MGLLATQRYVPLSSFLTGLINNVELSLEKWYLSLGASGTLFLCHWKTTLVPLATEQVHVTFALSSTTAYDGLFSITGIDTGTEEKTRDVGIFSAGLMNGIKLVSTG